jgi:hypothetical protein
MPKKDNTRGKERGTPMTSFRKNIYIITPIAVARRAMQFPQISKHLMMAEISVEFD